MAENLPGNAATASPPHHARRDGGGGARDDPCLLLWRSAARCCGREGARLEDVLHLLPLVGVSGVVAVALGAHAGGGRVAEESAPGRARGRGGGGDFADVEALPLLRHPYRAELVKLVVRREREASVTSLLASIEYCNRCGFIYKDTCEGDTAWGRRRCRFGAYAVRDLYPVRIRCIRDSEPEKITGFMRAEGWGSRFTLAS